MANALYAVVTTATLILVISLSHINGKNCKYRKISGAHFTHEIDVMFHLK